MTHEYVIALHGRIVDWGDAGPSTGSAIAWAADRVLAVGSDEAVRAISRGDSTFLDLAGCAVTPLDLAERLQPGTPADLVFWSGDPGDGEPIATLHGGHFTAGDRHRGPFGRG